MKNLKFENSFRSNEPYRFHLFEEIPINRSADTEAIAGRKNSLQGYLQ